jgi:hypothetical protein
MSDPTRMPASYDAWRTQGPPEDPECPFCEQPFDGDECECGFDPPQTAAEAMGYDRIEEVRGER